MRGGTEPAVTDANVALGYLNPRYLLGGRVPIDGAAARRALEEKVARPLGLSLEKAAYGVFNIVNNNMVNGIRRVSIERGYDPRDFVLVAAGGATGLHITALAREIGVRTVLVPKLASGLCAFGQIISDVKYNYMAACPMRVDGDTSFERVESLFRELERSATVELEKENFARDRIKINRSLDMRYVGQVHECSVDIGELSVSRDTIKQIRAAFDERHKQLYTYDEPESVVELVNLESTVSGVVSPIAPIRVAKAKGDSSAAIKSRRKMIFTDGADIAAIDTPIYDGDKLGAGDRLAGPGVIEEITTSIVVEPDWQAELHESGVYILRHQA
jgi:N-methylhydantoinase A